MNADAPKANADSSAALRNDKHDGDDKKDALRNDNKDVK
jgi:hypothetical protein